MGIADEKYKSLVELIKNDEIYDKKRNSLTALEVFKLLHNNYVILRDVLEPLRNEIGKNIEILDVDFNQGMQDDVGMCIKYLKDEKQHLLSLSNIEFEQVEVSSTDIGVENEIFVQNNKQLILDIFRKIDEYRLNDRIEIPSTSKKVIISDIADSFIIKDNESKVFSIITKHSQYDKGKILVNRINCNYPKIKELIENEDNVTSLYNHLRIYEEDVDKLLIKKLT